jgi:hypothetical protein
VYGWHYESHKNQEYHERLWPECIFCAGATLSEFFGSFIGWGSLRLLVRRYAASLNIDVASGIFIIIAVISITGYSFRLVEVFEGLVKKAE